jgi:hypothetical protein
LFLVPFFPPKENNNKKELNMHFFGVMLALAGFQALVVAQSVDPGTVPRATRGV